MENKLTFRDAERKDIPLVLSFIRQIAEYEKMSDAVIADEKTLEKYIFDQKKAEVFFAMEDNKEIGFALYYFNFSTFVGRSGLYLEDVFIKEEYRHKGYGKEILKKLAEEGKRSQLRENGMGMPQLEQTQHRFLHLFRCYSNVRLDDIPS